MKLERLGARGRALDLASHNCVRHTGATSRREFLRRAVGAGVGTLLASTWLNAKGPSPTDAINAKRREMGLEPFPIMPDAYEPVEEA